MVACAVAVGVPGWATGATAPARSRRAASTTIRAASSSSASSSSRLRLPHIQALPLGNGRDALGRNYESAPMLHRGTLLAAAGQAAGQALADDDSDDVYYRPLRPSDMEQCQVSARSVWCHGSE